MITGYISRSGPWALGADSTQWILYRRHSRISGKWDPVSYVRSTKWVLERCCRDNSVSIEDTIQLTRGLPDSFEIWKTQQTEADWRKIVEHTEEQKAADLKKGR